MTEKILLEKVEGVISSRKQTPNRNTQPIFDQQGGFHRFRLRHGGYSKKTSRVGYYCLEEESSLFNNLERNPDRNRGPLSRNPFDPNFSPQARARSLIPIRPSDF